MSARFLFALTLVISSAVMSNAVAEKAPDWNVETLTGDWGGQRSNLDSMGIRLEFVHKSDFLSVVSGGIKSGTAWMGNTEFKAKLDLERLWGWGSTTAYFHNHNQLGGKFNRDYVGAFMGVDNIENGVNTEQFDHAWIQKEFFDNRLSILAGIYAVDAEFYITDTSGLFIQPPYGPSNEQAQPVLGASQAPAIFPVGALSVRVKYTAPSDNYYVQYAISDGVPSDPNNPSGTHVQLNTGDGSYSIIEFGYTPPAPSESGSVPGEQAAEEGEYFNKTAIGYWRFSSLVDDQIDIDALGAPVRRVSDGFYFLSERTLMVEKNHPSQGLSGFVRFGTASRDIHQSDWSGSLGLRYRGLFSGRDKDIGGIAVTYSHASDKYQLLNNADSSQTQVEATYRAQLNPWFAVLPTVHYYQRPNMDKALQNTWVAGARAEIIF